MKLKQLILSSIAVGALAFTFGTLQPAQAAIGMENPGPAMNLEKPASVTTAHHINVDGKVVEPINPQGGIGVSRKPFSVRAAMASVFTA